MSSAGPGLRTYSLRSLSDIPGVGRLSADQLHAIEVVGAVLPFKTNAYVCEQLIDWAAVPDDPMFQLTFPQEGMLDPAQFDLVSELLSRGAGRPELDAAVGSVRRSLNPHPAGQVEFNMPRLGGVSVSGVQHKYRETVLFFPSQGQTCHAYCTYCFRWPQFVDAGSLRFAAAETDGLVEYLRAHPDVTDVLVTGGDPLIMRTETLRRYLEPLLRPEFAHVDLRFGTKAPAYWPYRFTHGDDADELMRLFDEVVTAGRHLAVMAHFVHPRELSTDAARAALHRIAATGAVVRCQAPLVRHVNADATVLAELWRSEVRLGAVPYYLFVERDTGARRYFEVPLAEALELFTTAFARVSGLARTVRGPVMSATHGKVLLDGVVDVGDERLFVLKMLQARDPSLVNTMSFARFDPAAVWFDDLVPVAVRFAPREAWYQFSLHGTPVEGLDCSEKLVGVTAAR